MGRTSIYLRFFGIVLFLCVFTSALYSQSFDFGIFCGKSSYLGEMQDEYYNSVASKPAYGSFLRTRFNKTLALRMQYLQTTLTGSDANQVDPLLNNRNLSFSTGLNELGLIAELTIVSFGKDRRNIRARSFLFGGIAGFHFNPRTRHNGKWVDLRPLGTEGQMAVEGVEPYQKFDYAYPFGWGFEFHVSKMISLGVELKLRKTRTDYLDDISGQYPDIEMLRANNPTAAALSFRTPEVVENYDHNPVGEQRGDEKKFDQYLFVGFTASVKFFERKSKKPDEMPVYFIDPIKH